MGQLARLYVMAMEDQELEATIDVKRVAQLEPVEALVVFTEPAPDQLDVVCPPGPVLLGSVSKPAVRLIPTTLPVNRLFRLHVLPTST